MTRLFAQLQENVEENVPLLTFTVLGELPYAVKKYMYLSCQTTE